MSILINVMFWVTVGSCALVYVVVAYRTRECRVVSHLEYRIQELRKELKHWITTNDYSDNKIETLELTIGNLENVAQYHKRNLPDAALDYLYNRMSIEYLRREDHSDMGLLFTRIAWQRTAKAIFAVARGLFLNMALGFAILTFGLVLYSAPSISAQIVGIFAVMVGLHAAAAAVGRLAMSQAKDW